MRSLLATLTLLIFAVPSPAFSDSHKLPDCVDLNILEQCNTGRGDMGDKLGRAFLNVLFLPLEIPSAIMANDPKNVVDVAFNTLELVTWRLKVRVLTTVVDVATFGIPLPFVGYRAITFGGRLPPYTFSPLLKEEAK